MPTSSNRRARTTQILRRQCQTAASSLVGALILGICMCGQCCTDDVEVPIIHVCIWAQAVQWLCCSWICTPCTSRKASNLFKRSRHGWPKAPPPALKRRQSRKLSLELSGPQACAACTHCWTGAAQLLLADALSCCLAHHDHHAHLPLATLDWFHELLIAALCSAMHDPICPVK